MESIKLEWFVILFLVFCIDNYLYYKMLTTIYNFKEKQKESILTIKTSSIMTLLSIHGFINRNDTQNLSLTMYTLGTIYFLSYLFTDIYIGNKEYSQSMQGLSGNIHHLSYILISILVLITNTSYVYSLFMISELPTLIMNIGSIKKYRNNDLFGLTFLITRILLHLFITITYRNNFYILFFASTSLIMHVYWFTIWCKKYLFCSDDI